MGKLLKEKQKSRDYCEKAAENLELLQKMMEKFKKIGSHIEGLRKVLSEVSDIYSNY
jgi:hypothetical protein